MNTKYYSNNAAFRSYLQNSNLRGIHTLVAQLLGVHLSHISAVKKGLVQISPRQAVILERFTKGELTRQKLRPNDWSSIWPELVKKN